MALGRQGERQADLMIGWAELPRSPGHASPGAGGEAIRANGRSQRWGTALRAEDRRWRGASGIRARRWGRTHHPEADVVAAATRAVDVAVGTAGEILTPVPGPAAQHTGIKVVSARDDDLGSVVLVQAPFPNRSRHIQRALDGGAGRVHADCDRAPEPTLEGVRPVGFTFRLPIGAQG